MSDFTGPIKAIKAFFRRNNALQEYRPPLPANVKTSPFGGLISVGPNVLPEVIRVHAVYNAFQRPEDVTVWGDPGKFSKRPTGTIRVLAEDLEPSTRGSFVIKAGWMLPREYEILAVTEHVRDGQNIWWNCLVGQE